MIRIEDDGDYEGNETLEIEIFLDPGTDGVMLDPAVTEVLILDNDGKSSTSICQG